MAYSSSGRGTSRPEKDQASGLRVLIRDLIKGSVTAAIATAGGREIEVVIHDDSMVAPASLGDCRIRIYMTLETVSCSQGVSPAVVPPSQTSLQTELQLATIAILANETPCSLRGPRGSSPEATSATPPAADDATHLPTIKQPDSESGGTAQGKTLQKRHILPRDLEDPETRVFLREKMDLYMTMCSSQGFRPAKSHFCVYWCRDEIGLRMSYASMRLNGNFGEMWRQAKQKHQALGPRVSSPEATSATPPAADDATHLPTIKQPDSESGGTLPKKLQWRHILPRDLEDPETRVFLKEKMYLYMTMCSSQGFRPEKTHFCEYWCRDELGLRVRYASMRSNGNFGEMWRKVEQEHQAK